MNFFSNLNQRERLLILVGIPAVLLVMFYLYIWQPIFEDRQRLQTAVPEQEATLAWMQHRLGGAAIPQSKNPGDSNAPLLTVIEKLAISARIQNAIQRVQPGNNGSVEIWFQEVVADQLFRWVDQLGTRGVYIESATITRGTPGLVTARIKVGRQ